jgi:hypothetical protein
MANRSVKQHIENILINYEIKIRNKTRYEDLQQERCLQIIGICFSLVLVLMIASNFIMNTVVTGLYAYAILNVIMIILNLYQGKKHKDTVKLADEVLEDELSELQKELEKNEQN